MENLRGFLTWEIVVRGEVVPSYFEWHAWKNAQKFVNENDGDIVSIAFLLTELTAPVNNQASFKYSYKEMLTKDELANVSDEWVEDRKRKLLLDNS